MNQHLEDYLSSKDYQQITQDCIIWIRDWFAQNGPQSPVIIGVSGGKDSSIVSALCVEALGKDRVLGVMMPNGTQSDISVSRDLVSYLGITNWEVNIHDSVEAVRNSILVNGIQPSAQMGLNVPPRIRMTTLYAISQCFGGRVSNNCNRSENYIGYSTIFGDAAGDFSPLANLTVAEVRKIGDALKLPEEFVYKAPSDGLSGKTDEDSIGFTYEALDTLILTGYCPDEELREKIEKRHKANLFKLKPMPEFVF